MALGKWKQRFCQTQLTQCGSNAFRLTTVSNQFSKIVFTRFLIILWFFFKFCIHRLLSCNNNCKSTNNLGEYNWDWLINNIVICYIEYFAIVIVAEHIYLFCLVFTKFVVDQKHGQCIDIQVFDHDVASNNDDSLGTYVDTDRIVH